MMTIVTLIAICIVVAKGVASLDELWPINVVLLICLSLVATLLFFQLVGRASGLGVAGRALICIPLPAMIPIAVGLYEIQLIGIPLPDPHEIALHYLWLTISFLATFIFVELWQFFVYPTDSKS